MKRTIVAAVLTLSPFIAFAGQLLAPEEITHDRRTYKLAFHNKAGNQEIFEYTTNGEPVEAWTSLITLHYAGLPNVTGGQWVRSMKQVLGSNKPKPFYEAKESKGTYFTRAVMMPSAMFPHYESNVQRAYISTCDGLVIYQYAVKADAAKDKKAVIAENEALAEGVIGMDWQPQCQ